MFRLYTIEWDLPYRMYYQTTICVAEMFGALTRLYLHTQYFSQSPLIAPFAMP